MTISEQNSRPTVPQRCRTACAVFLLLLAWGVAWVGTGCSSPQIEDKNGRLNESFAVPQFLDGPTAAVLTNVNGFSARVELTIGGEKTTAVILGRGTQILFADERGIKHPSKRRPGEQSFFIWDVATSKGFVVNEPLQGYAPISSKLAITNVTITDLEGVSETIDGRRCRQATVKVGLDGQDVAEMSIWRAAELKNFPVLIKANNGQLTAHFVDIHLDKPSAGLFSPPATYTQHANAEVMLNDLVERLLRSRQKPSSEWNDTHPDEREPGTFNNGVNPGIRRGY